MKIFSLMRFRRKASPENLAPVSSSGWWPQIYESFSGAFQRNVVVDKSTVSAYWAVFSCVTLIASDISKLPLWVMQFDSATQIWKQTLQRPVLRKPNHYQTRMEFIFSWVICQLLHGNTYVLKERDEKGFVRALYILDPCRVTPLVAPDGGVYYQLNCDLLSQIPTEGRTVPASEIIHDRMYTLHHPLIGVSPIYACGIAAMQGNAIQQNSAKFFENMSRPSGVLTAPGSISDATAARIKAYWEENFKGSNIGRLAVLGDALKYEAMTINAQDAQLIEQLKMTGEMICACYHVPPYKLGLGAMPTVNNTSVLGQQYYDQCLQYPIEKMEARLDDGLELEFPFECWFDLKPLLRMDQAARYAVAGTAIKDGWLAPNEARRQEDLPPVEGGDTPYMQIQNYSLASLDKRDKKDAEGSVDIQAEAMNGAQVTSLQGLIVACSEGKIPAETARAAIRAAFPLLSVEEVNAMIDPLANFEPAVEDHEPAGDAPVASTDDPSPDEEVDEQEEALQFAIDLTKELGNAEIA